MSINSLGLNALFGQPAAKPKPEAPTGVAAALSQAEAIRPSSDLSQISTKKTAAEEMLAKAEAKADAEKLRIKSVLDEIREKGIYAWAQEEKLEKLKERIKDQVMEKHGLTDDSLAAMDPESRATAEATIQEEITRLVKQAMEDAMKGKMAKAEDEQKSGTAMIIDISV